MGNQSSKSKHRVEISGGFNGTLETAYGERKPGKAYVGSGSPVQQAKSKHQPSGPPPGVNLDHRLSLPANSFEVQQEQAKRSAQVQPRHHQQHAQPRPYSMAPAGTSPISNSPQAQPRSQLQQQQQQPQVQVQARPLSSLTPPSLGNSTMTADVQLVLNQLIDKKPKYSLLRQLDFTELDDRARFVVFEAACDLLDQAKTIESLQEERRMMRSNLNVVRRVASIDHLDNPRHRRVASQELANCISQELQRKPPKLATPTSDSAEASASGGGLLGDLVASWQLLERHFLEHIRQELLIRRGHFADSVEVCQAMHRLLVDMLEAAETLHRRRLDDLVETVTSPTDARGMQVLRARLKLPTEESKAIRASASQLLSHASDLCQLPWDSLVDASRYPAFVQAPGSVAGFLSNCSSWCWRCVCSSLGRVSVRGVEVGAPFRQEMHRAELGLGVGRPVSCCLWPILYQSKTVICKALVQTAAGTVAAGAD